ncbi:AAA family ATPase [Alkaliphilus transvaalensis]|uniref:AAA family ATPase n=1 Tax=Alkaliphilus transvaalensis TaxID=114628 RepID=UPI000478916E|nr:AAA family ATPase [Alkaliphilus transvaalensis]
MFLLQMAGFPGSGKSTLSRAIANKMDAIVIDRDIIKNAMVESGVSQEIVANASYMVVYDLVKFYLGMKRSVIIDTPCYYHEILNYGIEKANEFGVDYKYIECRVEDYSIIEERLKSRESLVTQIKSTSKENFEYSKDKSKKPQDGNYIVVDTSLDNDANMELIIRYLEKKN